MKTYEDLMNATQEEFEEGWLNGDVQRIALERLGVRIVDEEPS